MSREEFVGIVTADQPDSPAYFTYDAVLNAKERPTLEEALERELRPLSFAGGARAAARGRAELLDTRDPADFEGAHLAGSVNVGRGGSYATWCGTILDAERLIAIAADPGREGGALRRAGSDSTPTRASLRAGCGASKHAPTSSLGSSALTAEALAEQLESPVPPLLLDVRTRARVVPASASTIA